MRNGRRLPPPRLILVTVVAVIATAGCTSAISGQGSLTAAVGGPAASSTPGGPVSTSAPVGSGSPVPNATASSGAGGFGSGALSAKLEPAPAGSTPWTSSWARNTEPTLAQFVANFYLPADQTSETAVMNSEGIAEIAHRTWIAADGDQADVVVLRFATEQGAGVRFTGVTAGRDDDATLKPTTAPAGVKAYYQPTLDDDGNIRAFLYAQTGVYEIEEFYFSPTTLRTADASAWISAQLARL